MSEAKQVSFADDQSPLYENVNASMSFSDNPESSSVKPKQLKLNTQVVKLVVAVMMILYLLNAMYRHSKTHLHKNTKYRHAHIHSHPYNARYEHRHPLIYQRRLKQ